MRATGNPMAVIDLFEYLEAQAAIGGPMDWPRIRKEIHAEHERAITTADREALLTIHKIVMDTVERQIGAEDLAEFRKIRRQDYRLLLIQEAIIGDNSGNINPQRMAAITRREVEAGRMAADDELHNFSVAGATILAPLPPKHETTLLARLRNLFIR
jgi:hypothetical protein